MEEEQTTSTSDPPSPRLIMETFQGSRQRPFWPFFWPLTSVKGHSSLSLGVCQLFQINETPRGRSDMEQERDNRRIGFQTVVTVPRNGQQLGSVRTDPEDLRRIWDHLEDLCGSGITGKISEGISAGSGITETATQRVKLSARRGRDDQMAAERNNFLT